MLYLSRPKSIICAEKFFYAVQLKVSIDYITGLYYMVSHYHKWAAVSSEATNEQYN